MRCGAIYLLLNPVVDCTTITEEAQRSPIQIHFSMKFACYHSVWVFYGSFSLLYSELLIGVNLSKWCVCPVKH